MGFAKIARSGIGLVREKGWLAGKNPMVLFILAWVLGPFLPRKRDKRMGLQVNLKIEIEASLEKRYWYCREKSFPEEQGRLKDLYRGTI